MTFGTAYGRLLQRSLLHVTANIQDTAQTEGSVKGKEFVYSLHDYCPQNSLSQINPVLLQRCGKEKALFRTAKKKKRSSLFAVILTVLTGPIVANNLN